MKAIFLLFLIQCNLHCFSQQKYSLHGSQFQIEALGPGSLFSFNFDTRILKTEKGPGFRIGLGGSPLGTLGKSCNTGAQISLPVGLNYLFGCKNNYVEIGGGIVPLLIGGTKLYCINMKKSFFSDETETYKYLLAGYRYQPQKKKGATYRAFISPLFQNGFNVKWWGGVSIGFKL